MFLKPGRNVYGDSGGGALFSRDAEDPMCLDSCDLLSLETGNTDLLLCESFDYREAENENDKRYFFIMICFMMGRLKVTKSYRYSCFLDKKRDMGLLFLSGLLNVLGIRVVFPENYFF